jgi:hypothetical protein
MPLQKLQLKPGVNRDQTNYTNEGGWYECDKIRFRSGYPQKLGGWLKYNFQPLVGVCRQMFNWVTTSSENILALGTNAKVYLEAGTNLYNITPYRQIFTTPATDNSINTASGTTTVTINLTSHGASTGDYVTIADVIGTGSPSAIGGIPISEINGEHQVTVLNSSAFTITVPTTATSSVTNAGGTAIVISFELPPGSVVTTYGYGWGAGVWSRGPWGSGAIAPITIFQRDWWFDNFDNDLVMNIRNGAIYYWEFDPVLTSRAVLLSSKTIDGIAPADVPAEAMQTMVSQGNKHLLAFGCTPFGGGALDPLLIRWATQDQPNVWTPLVTNSAGFLRVSRGSKIVRAIATRQETIVFTDATMYSLQFLGTTDVFGLQELSDNISIAGPRSAVSVNNVVYWMGTDKFFAYSGRVETLPCSLRNHVFNDLNFDQLEQIVCGTNEGWHEVWWFYPTANSDTNNAYVVYNYLEQVWYYGYIERSAWLDSPLRKYPQAVGGAYIYDHERGTNDDTLPMVSFIQSSDFDVIDGDQFILMKRIIPDLNFNGSTNQSAQVTMIIKPHNFPGAPYQTSRSQNVIETTVDQYTEQIFIRARARQLGLEIRSTGLDTQWQLGSPRIDGRTDGKR